MRHRQEPDGHNRRNQQIYRSCSSVNALVKQSLEDWTREYLSEGIRPNWVAIYDDVGNKEADSTVATFTKQASRSLQKRTISGVS